MRKIFLIAFLCLFTNIWGGNEIIDGICYFFNSSNNTAEVTNVSIWGTVKYKGAVIIPSSVTYKFREYTVTGIENSAFENCTELTSVTIPNSVTSIGSDAFKGCKGLTSVTIPNSVTYIGEGTFRYCSGLTNITIPNSVTFINHYAFSYCI